MKYLVYALLSLSYAGIMYSLCFVWHWSGWLSYIGHILSIFVLTVLFVIAICLFALYDNRKSLWNTYVVPFLIILDMHFRFWEWLGIDTGERMELLRQRWSKF